MTIIALSIAIQFFAAFYAIWLIKKTGILYSWCFISLALFMMGIRRIISLYRLVESGYVKIDYAMESTGLVISISMLAGVAGIGKIFVERKKMQQKIEELLHLKDLLLKEVHHRVKNHMNSVSGMLTIQADSIGDDNAKQSILEARSRMESILALYSKLCSSADYRSISMAEYMSHLIDEIIKNNSLGTKLTVIKEIQDANVGVDKLNYIGIIVNEIITNSTKYAFTGMNDGTIKVRAGIENGNIHIQVSDNGRGIDEHESRHSGFGMELIRNLVESMDGKLLIENKAGACYSVSLKI